MLLDTGAERSVIDSTLAESLKLEKVSTASVANQQGVSEANVDLASHVKLGGKTFRAFPLLTRDLSAMSSAVGSPVGGIVGTDILISSGSHCSPRAAGASGE